MPIGSSFRFDYLKDGPNLDDPNVNSLDSGLNVYATPGALTINVTSGRFQSAGAFVDFAGSVGVVVPPSTVGQAIWIDGAGVLQQAAAFPATSHLPLALVDTSATEVTAITDKRPGGGSAGTGAATAPLELVASGAVGEATYVKFDGPAAQQIDLSALAGRLGRAVTIRNASVSSVTLAADGAEQIDTAAASGNTVPIAAGAVLRLVALPGEWSEA